MIQAARKLKTDLKENNIFLGIEKFKDKANQTFDDAKDRASAKIGETKTRVRKAQSIGVTHIVKTQIKTDSWLRETANRLTHPKATGMQTKIIELADMWMGTIPENYDRLNAKEAVRSIREFGLSDILRIEAHEISHKNRKTVLKYISERLAKYEAGTV